MLGKPLVFVFLNIVLFFTTLSITGFNGSILISFLIAVFVVLYNRRQVGFINSLALSVVYLMIFDNEVFAFTSLKLRIWYLPLIFLLLYYQAKSLKELRRTKINLERIFVVVLFVLASFWFLIDPLDGKLSIMKYLLFSIGTIFVLKRAFYSIAQIIGTEKLIDYFISLAVFVSTWGIIQFIMNTLGIGNYYMYDYYNIRPSGFFSETTWYAEYSFFGLILLSCKTEICNNKKFNIFVFFIIISLVLSATRNAFLAVFVWLFVELFLNLVRGKFVVLKLSYLVAIIIIIIVLISFFYEQIIFIYEKMSSLDDSSQGRLNALYASWNSFLDSPIIGHGFSFDPSKDSIGISGTSIGAKNSNLFLMILHVFGLIGLVPFLLLLFVFFIKNVFRYKNGNIRSKYGIIFLSVFLSMSMFAPLHQFPFGMYIIALALFFSSKNIYNENRICHSFV